jgi:voltage-gated potassium channel Kch
VFLPSQVLSGAVALFRIGFLLIVTVALIYQVGVSKKVSLPVIVGAIDGYLLLGVVGGVAFAILDLLQPGALLQSSGTLARVDYVYFSFITMLTIGYGDIVPVSISARTVAMFLAVGGQMYIAILVAVLVGKFITEAQAEQA